MLLTRWSPLDASWARHVHNLQSEVNRLFSRWNDWSDFPDEAAAFPPLNVWEEEGAFHVEAELPGLTMKDVEIYVTGQNQLTIKGERTVSAPEKSAPHRRERQFGRFVRSLTLPSPVEEGKVEARLENGVLSIRLPKHERAKPRRIPVKG